MNWRRIALPAVAVALSIPAAAQSPQFGEKVKFENASGAAAFSIKPKDDGAKLVDGSEKELARFHSDEGKVRIKASDDSTLGYVTGSPPKWRVKDAGQQTTLFEYIRQDDGDYKLENGKGALLLKVKKRDDGYELKSPEGKTLRQVDVKKGKVSIRDAADKALLTTNDPADAAAASAFALDPLTLPQKAGLFLILSTTSQKPTGGR